MDAERWQRARRLFDAMADADEAARVALREACDDAAVRDEALALLRAHDAARTTGALGARPAALLDELARRDAGARVGRHYGAWRLVEAIGRGGMGEVYLAERTTGGFTQRAALKLVRDGILADDLLARFRHERQILASLEHPNIARLLDGGAGPDGEPFLALEYVEGQPLDAYCDAHALDVPRRLALFVAVCEAVAYAHARLVVHRDLKPGNVLVDAAGTAKLLDFGVAKLLDAEGAAEATAARLRLFTPEYAAPEQIRGDATTTAVDVYALGVLLYTLLTGRSPYGETRGGQELEHAVLTRDAARPSDAVARAGDEAAIRAARARASTPTRLRARLRGDLDAIVLKALRKDPAERHASARLLADDVRAHLAQRPVAARRGDRRYRVARFVQRHALAVTLGALAAVSLVVGLAVATWQAREARAQSAVARAEAAKSREALAFMTSLFALADPGQAQGERVTARELLATGATRIRDTLRDQPSVRAELLRAMGEAHLGLGLYGDALPLLEEAARTPDLAIAEQGAARLSEGIALTQLGRFDDAIARLEALRASLAAAAADDALVARVDVRLAQAYQAKGRLDDAERAFTAALATQRRRDGDAARETQETAIRYVSLLVLRDRDEDARELAQHVVDQLRALPEPRDDAFLARGIAALAMVLSNTGPLDEAERLRREELALNARIYGDDHPITTSTRNDLAAALYAQRRYEESAALFARVLDERRAHLGAEHPGVALAATNYANVLYSLGRSDEAEAPAREALRLRLAVFGERHHVTAASLRIVGQLAIDRGDLDEAQSLLERSIAAYRAALGDDAVLQVGATNDLVRVRVLRGTPDPGCALARRAQALSAPNNPPGSPTARYQQALVEACEARAGDAVARAALRESAAVLRAAFGPDERRVHSIDALVAAVATPARGA